MSSNANWGITNLPTFKLAFFVFSIFLIVIYDWLPEQKITLYPDETATLSIYSDEEIGGNSRVKLTDKTLSKFQCNIPRLLHLNTVAQLLPGIKRDLNSTI